MSGGTQTLQFEPQGIGEKMIGWARNLYQIQCTHPGRGVRETLIFLQAYHRLEANLVRNGLLIVDQDAPGFVTIRARKLLQYWGERLSEDAPYLFDPQNGKTFAVVTEVGTRQAQLEECENVGK
jgi:aminopeptidase-like protein